MTTCRDCIHYDVCNIWDTWNDELYADGNSDRCHDYSSFKDKSRFVELPCGVGDTFYAIVNAQIIAYNCVGFKYGHSAVTKKDNELLLLTVYDMEFVFGEEAFLSNEEAEEKLKELNENGR